MESLTARQIAPFQALINMIKINYETKPEVFKTLVAVLCDHNANNEESVKKTKHYIPILLSDNSDLAEVLLTFLPEPTAPDPVTSSWSAPMVIPAVISPCGDTGVVRPQLGVGVGLPCQSQPGMSGLSTPTNTFQWCPPLGNLATSAGKSECHTASMDTAAGDKVQPLIYPKHPLLRVPIPLSFPEYPVHCGMQLLNQQLPPRDKHVVYKSSSSTECSIPVPLRIGETTKTANNHFTYPLPLLAPISTWQNLVSNLNTTSSFHPCYSNAAMQSPSTVTIKSSNPMSTTAAQLPKQPTSSLKRSISAPAYHPLYVTPFSQILNTTACTSSKLIDCMEESRQLPKEALAELNAPPRKMPRLRNKPGREMESLKALTTKLKLACVEKKLETMKLAITCAEKKLECEQKRLVCEQKHLETIRLSQLYADLLQPASNLSYSSRTPINLIASGIPFQIQDPKTQATIHTTARNLTSFPYIQKIILPDGETHTVNM